MIKLRVLVLVSGFYVVGCNHQSNLQEGSSPAGQEMEAMPSHEKVINLENDRRLADSAHYVSPSVIFYTPSPDEINQLASDQTAREGLLQAVGDFAYYASIVSDSLENMQVKIHFTNQRYLTFSNDAGDYRFDRLESSSPIGLILYDGQGVPENVPGMQTHLSLLATISNRFNSSTEPERPLLEYFEPIEPTRLHVFSTHSDILNQTGNKIDPVHYPKLGSSIASRAGKFHMSVFAYQKFEIKDSLQAIICRVPSRYDESAVKLFIWNPALGQVVDELELAENVWNEQWIMVKDSWISLDHETGTISIIQRKKEAEMNEGARKESDNLYQWVWSGSGFMPITTSGISKNDFPLKDWESYQEPESPKEITLVDENYVWLPLTTGDLSWENLILLLPRPFSIKKEPIKNQLALKQIDTLVTISRPGVSLKFYRSPGENLIVEGSISDSSILFKQNLKVGMSKVEFVQTFDKLSNHQAVPDLVKVRSINHDRVLSYYFQNDTLARIEVMNFIH